MSTDPPVFEFEEPATIATSAPDDVALLPTSSRIPFEDGAFKLLVPVDNVMLPDSPSVDSPVESNTEPLEKSPIAVEILTAPDD